MVSPFFRLYNKHPDYSMLRTFGCKQVYKDKLKAYGTHERLKSRLVAKRFSQVDSVDFSKTI